MAGHSKWKNIMHKKEKTDAQKANIFSKISKEIAIAIREGGPDPAANGKLRELIAKARSNNVPNDNIERIIKKFTGENEVAYEHITYEGYGPGGVAVIVEATTDNRNRTASDLRHYFDKYGGNLGQSGCVSFLFSNVGVIIIPKDGKIDEDSLMEAALEAGAADFIAEDDEVFEIHTDYTSLYSVRDALAAAGYTIVSAEFDKIPSTTVTLTDEEAVKNMQILLARLDDNEDVQNVYHNWENEV